MNRLLNMAEILKEVGKVLWFGNYRAAQEGSQEKPFQENCGNKSQIEEDYEVKGMEAANTDNSLEKIEWVREEKIWSTAGDGAESRVSGFLFSLKNRRGLSKFTGRRKENTSGKGKFEKQAEERKLVEVGGAGLE